jgi:hypothetical protein
VTVRQCSGGGRIGCTYPSSVSASPRHLLPQGEKGTLAQPSLPIANIGDWLRHRCRLTFAPCGRRWPSEARSDEGCLARALTLRSSPRSRGEDAGRQVRGSADVAERGSNNPTFYPHPVQPLDPTHLRKKRSPHLSTPFAPPPYSAPSPLRETWCAPGIREGRRCRAGRLR